ncbi:T9SS type A sorting domain-containing protein [Calditrichota bacterium]
MKYYFVCLLALFTMAVPLFSDTEVAGPIDGGQWTIEGSPYILTGDVTISTTNTLSIDPGVRVEGEEGFRILVLGGISAQGTTDSPILFTTHDTDYYWDGLDIDEASEDSYFEYCIIEYANTYHGRTNGTAVYLRESSAEFQHCELRNNYTSNQSSAFYSFEAEVIMQHCWIHDNIALGFGGIDFVDSDVEFSYNLVTNNLSGFGGAMAQTSGFVLVDHCTFVNNNSTNPTTGTNFWGTAEREFTNCIVIADTSYLIISNNHNSEISFSCFSHNSNLWGIECFVDDPLFIDAENGNYQLDVDSPCIDAGDPDFARDDDGSITDLGCFPFVGPGSLSGIIINSMNDEPLDSVYVDVYRNDELIDWILTDENGLFGFQRIEEGEYSVLFSKSCFSDTLFTGILVEEDENTTLNHTMTYPEFLLDPLELTVELIDDEEVMEEVVLTNDGNGHLDYSTEIFYFDPRINDDFSINGWSLVDSLVLDERESRYRGVVFIDGYIFVSGSSNFDPMGPNKIYQYSHSGDSLIATFDQPVPQQYRSSAGFFGLAWDGEYMYGVDRDRMYQMEVNPALGDVDGSIELFDSWELPIDDARYLAYDQDNDLFWMGDIQHDVIFGIDRDSEILRQFEHEIFPRGLSVYPDDEDGYTMYFTCRATGGDTTRIIKMHPETGEYREVYEYGSPEDEMLPAGTYISSTWHPLFWTMMTLVDNGDQDYIQFRLFSNNHTIFSISEPTGIVPGNSETNIEFEFRGGDIVTGEYPFFVKFNNNACEEEDNVVEVSLIVTRTNPVNSEQYSQPLDWSFKGVYPNPFNPVVNIEFSLKHSVHVRAYVYNLMGQEVAVIADQYTQAGEHQLVFDAENLSSGIYLLRFEAGPLKVSEKLLLIK